jgi:hypothetical protein
MWAPQCPSQTDTIHAIDLEMVHQETYAGIERRFGELNRSYVV